MKLAAVDIGSNAVRLLFAKVSFDKENLIFKKLALVRLPIRLGEDVFLKGKISEKKIAKLSKALLSFQLLSEVYGIINFRVCATSAMRNASNKEEVLNRIKEELGINIDIIDGEEEAKLIFNNHLTSQLDPEKKYLHVDVGGGSTELTVFCNGEKLAASSFKIGTLRLKNNLVKEKDWKELISWIELVKEKYKPEISIGTGGNINQLYKTCGLANNVLFKYNQLKETSEILKKYSLEERIIKFQYRRDRADVIIHASKIYLNVMKAFQIEEMIVPKIGLADGIIYQLWKYQNNIPVN
jgi:exopolyphosphatase/guanosine-5'-triphosphate,3'-diphosphate pyrophosphatase